MVYTRSNYVRIEIQFFDNFLFFGFISAGRLRFYYLCASRRLRDNDRGVPRSTDDIFDTDVIP